MNSAVKRMNCRPCIERMAFMAEELRSGKGISLLGVASRFEVSYKTILRDFDFLRDRLRYNVRVTYPGNTGEPHLWFLVSAPRPRL